MSTLVDLPGAAPALAPAPAQPPHIVADLMPQEVIDSRRGRKVRRRVLIALVVSVMLLAGWYAAATVEAVSARHDLVMAEDATRDITRQQGQFRKLVDAQTGSDTIRTQLETLLADDLRWSRLLGSLRAAAPAGVTVDVVIGALDTDDAGAADGTSVGTVTLSGTAPDKRAVAAYVDALARVPAVTNPFPTDANDESGTVGYTIRLGIAESALGGRYTTPSPTPSGGK
jgi:hypothetical protein